MKTGNHLSDTEIQQFALDEHGTDQVMTAHVAYCAHCSGRVQFYQKMARSISVMPGETFDFELAPLVLAQVPARKSKQALELVFVVCISLIGILAVVGLLCYQHAGPLNDMLRNRGTIVYAFAATCGLLFSFLTINVRQEYILKIHRLGAPGRLQQFPRAAV